MDNQEKKITEPTNKWVYEYTKNPLSFKVTPPDKIEEPSILSKYYAINKHSIDALKNQYLYGAHPNQLNDPFDCFPYLIHFDSTTEKEKSKVDINKFYHVYKLIGIISLTDNKNNLNEQMWALYTNFCGFLINFDVKELKKNNELHGPFPVNYVEDINIININSVSEYLCLLYQTNIKKEVWKNESEWRFLGEKPDMSTFDLLGEKEYVGSIDRNFKYSNKAIKSIYLGFHIFTNQHLDNKFSAKRKGDLLKITFNDLSLKKKFNIKLKELLNYLSSFDKDIYQIGIDEEKLRIGPMKINIEKISSNKFDIKYL